MRFHAPALAGLLLAVSALAPAAHAQGLNRDVLSGTVFGIGQAHSRHDDTGEGTGIFADVNHIHVFLNGGISYKHFDEEDVANAYVGVGLAGLVQLQVGEGTEGMVKRVRTDINLARMVDFFSGRKQNQYNQTLGTRLTFTFAGEEYSDDERFDNFQAGVGLIF
jgi:hypothetical protein